MLYIIAEHFASLLDGIIMVAFLAVILGFRDGRKKYTIIFVLLQYIVAQYFSEKLILQTVLQIAINIAYSRFCLKNTCVMQCIWSIGLMALYIFSSCIVFPLLSLVVHQPISAFVETGQITRIFTLIIGKLFQCTLIWGVMIKYRNQLKLKLMESVLVIMIMISSIFILSGFLLINIDMEISGNDQVRILGIGLSILVVLFCCIFLVIHISRMNVAAENSKFLRLQFENQKAMIEKAYEMQKEARIIKHDLRHYVTTWLNELKSGDSEQTQHEMEMFLGKNAAYTGSVYYVKNNEWLNSVLFDYFQQCKVKSIDCQCEVTTFFPKDREMDMAIILSNLLENAVRAEEAVASGKRRIKIEMFKIHEKRHVVVSNYIEKSVLSSNPMLSTTKNDKQNHGYGVASVKNIVRKYDAFINIEEEDSNFVVHISGI